LLTFLLQLLHSAAVRGKEALRQIARLWTTITAKPRNFQYNYCMGKFCRNGWVLN